MSFHGPASPTPQHRILCSPLITEVTGAPRFRVWGWALPPEEEKKFLEEHVEWKTLLWRLWKHRPPHSPFPRPRQISFPSRLALAVQLLMGTPWERDFHVVKSTRLSYCDVQKLSTIFKSRVAERAARHHPTSASTRICKAGLLAFHRPPPSDSAA